MMRSPGSSRGINWSITASTGAPAFTMIINLARSFERGDEIFQRSQPMSFLPGCAATKSLHRLRVRLWTATV